MTRDDYKYLGMTGMTSDDLGYLGTTRDDWHN